MWVDFFVLAPDQNSRWALTSELFDWFERICRQRMCAFFRESKDGARSQGVQAACA
jgi:hypothetical protein